MASTRPRPAGDDDFVKWRRSIGVIRKILAHVGVGASGVSPGPAPPEPGAAAS